MTWSRFDDGYDEHEKIQDAWEADPATIGLHVMATTACNRWLSDGVLRPRWLARMMPDKRHRERVLAVMVEVGLFDRLGAGEIRTAEDAGGHSIQLGPFAEDRYIVHDFLDRHDSSVMVKERRRRDSERKARGRSRPDRAEDSGIPAGVRDVSARTPRGHDAEGAWTPSGGQPESEASRARGSAARAPASRPDPTRPDPELLPPNPPQAGGRKRDLAAFEHQLTEWSRMNFPGAKPSKVQALAAKLREHGLEPTADAMRSYAATHPAWSLTSTEAAA